MVTNKRKKKVVIFLVFVLLAAVVFTGIYFSSNETNFDTRSSASGITSTDNMLDRFWTGTAKFLPQEEVKIIDPTGVLKKGIGHGRFNALQIGNTVYTYFRNEINCANGKVEFCNDIYAGISNDGGATFTVVPTPVLKGETDYPGIGRIQGMFDQHVVFWNNKYYMVTDGYGAPGCLFYIGYATSDSPTSGWSMKKILSCTNDFNSHTATPNLVQDKDGSWYLQWVYMDFVNKITTRHQQKINLTSPEVITNPQANQFNQSVAGEWDDRNFGSADVTREGDYYYMFYEGANSLACLRDEPYNESLWGIGVARTTDLSTLFWDKSKKNPFALAQEDGLNANSCWISYAQITKIGASYYLYYENPLTYWTPTDQFRETFRRKLVECTGNCGVVKVIGKIVVNSTNITNPASLNLDTCSSVQAKAYLTSPNQYTFMFDIPHNTKYCIKVSTADQATHGIVSSPVISDQVSSWYCKTQGQICNQSEITNDSDTESLWRLSLSFNKVTCTPSCTSKSCGDSDGCSGKCVVQSCGTGKICNASASCVNSATTFNITDINQDGAVNGSDYNLFVVDYLSYRNTAINIARSDLNKDGKVDAADYNIFVNEYIKARQ